MNIIQYKYLKEEEDRNTITVMGGLGKDWYKDIGNWKCQTRLEAKGGMSVDFKGKVTPELSMRAENKMSHSSLPWLALSSWLQASGGFMGASAEGGVMLSGKIQFKGYSVEPFVGIERHYTPMDKKYGSEGNPYENYHVLGVTIKY